MFPVVLDHPISTKKLPSSGKTIRIRPFLEKERKLLLMVAESGEKQSLKEIMDVIKQIANNCIIDPLDINTLPVIDLEWLFLQLRIISMGEIVSREFICNNLVNEKSCGGIMKVALDLSQVEVVNIDVNRTIKLSSTVSIKMKLPTILGEDFDTEYDAIISCIEFVADKEQIYYAKDYSKAELHEFITHLSMAQFQMLEEYYNSIPYLKTVINPKCKKCGFQHEIIIEGLQSFFI